MQTSEEFKIFIEDMSAGKYKNALQIPKKIWGSLDWEYLSEKQSKEIFLPLLRSTIQRALKTMPEIYKKQYESRKVRTNIDSMENFYQIPALVKDTTTSGIGFREKVINNPMVMMPSDVKSAYVYNSGGTQGVPTPTFLTPLDKEIESEALKRVFGRMGINSGDVVLTTYNLAHKGGEMNKEGVIKLGATCILRRQTDTPRDIINIIKSYKVNVLMTTQGTPEMEERVKKGGGIYLSSLIEEGEDVLEKNIKVIFLAGYSIMPEAISWANDHNIKIATALGSTEAIPQATGTISNAAHQLCCHNNMHIINGPHYVEVVKHEDGVLVPAKPKENGILCYTTIGREGTIYLRYMPGDSARIVADKGACSCGIKSAVITDVGRIIIPDELVTNGCCIG